MSKKRSDTCFELERKLGLVKGVQRNVSLTGILTRTLESDIKSIVALHHGVYQALRNDDGLNAKIDDLFDQYGPILWATAADRRGNVVEAGNLDQPSLSPRDLYFSIPEDRKQ